VLFGLVVLYGLCTATLTFWLLKDAKLYESLDLWATAYGQKVTDYMMKKRQKWLCAIM